jgi:dihydroflavonol-4-reductase
MGKKMMWASSAKAERELGWRVILVEGALRKACAWFVRNGYAPEARIGCSGC